MAYKLSELRKCNSTLFMRPELLEAMPTPELAAYIKRCFAYGSATMYPTTSMYGVCILHAMRYFNRDQFLVLKYEDLMRMEPSDILEQLSAFTGLHLDEDVVRR